jgi:hypothetical protein
MITSEEWDAARKAWPDDEDTSFTLSVASSSNGTPWMSLACSAHGGVVAATSWDLGELVIAAERHYVTGHLRQPPAATGQPGLHDHLEGRP